MKPLLLRLTDAPGLAAVGLRIYGPEGDDRGVGVAADADSVCDGDSLLCACSRADATAGRCHRVVAARLLVEAGWAVTLDGVEVAGE